MSSPIFSNLSISVSQITHSQVERKIIKDKDNQEVEVFEFVGTLRDASSAEHKVTARVNTAAWTNKCKKTDGQENSIDESDLKSCFEKTVASIMELTPTEVTAQAMKSAMHVGLESGQVSFDKNVVISSDLSAKILNLSTRINTEILSKIFQKTSSQVSEKKIAPPEIQKLITDILPEANRLSDQVSNLSLDKCNGPANSPENEKPFHFLRNLYALHYEITETIQTLKTLQKIGDPPPDLSESLTRSLTSLNQTTENFKSWILENKKPLDESINILNEHLLQINFNSTELEHLKEYEKILTFIDADKDLQAAEYSDKQLQQVKGAIKSKQPQPYPIASPPTAGKGIPNVGNSCYMNSSLQAIMHSPLLAARLQNALPANTPENVTQVHTALQSFRSVYNLENEKISQGDARTLRKTIFESDLVPGLAPAAINSQHDASEFILAPLTALNAKFSLRTIRSADEELTVMNPPQDAFILPLQIKEGATTFQGMINSFKTEEVDDQQNQWDISPGRSLSKYLIQNQIANEIPDVLVIQTVRMNYDKGQQKRVKVDPPITWESDEVDLAELMAPELRGSEESTRYRLVSYVNHHGTPEVGHYTANARFNNQWYKYNDDSAVRQLQAGDEKNDREHAYIVVLERITPNT